MEEITTNESYAQRTEIRRMEEDPIIVVNEKSFQKSVTTNNGTHTRNEIHRRQSFRFRDTSHLTRSVYMLKYVLLSSYNNCQTCCNIDELSCKRNETYPQLCSTKREREENHSNKTHPKAHRLKKSNSLRRGMPLLMLGTGVSLIGDSDEYEEWFSRIEQFPDEIPMGKSVSFPLLPCIFMSCESQVIRFISFIDQTWITIESRIGRQVQSCLQGSLASPWELELPHIQSCSADMYKHSWWEFISTRSRIFFTIYKTNSSAFSLGLESYLVRRIYE